MTPCVCVCMCVCALQAYETKLQRVQSQARAAESKVAQLTQDVADLQAQLDDERITAETASRQLGELQQMQVRVRTVLSHACYVYCAQQVASQLGF